MLNYCKQKTRKMGRFHKCRTVALLLAFCVLYAAIKIYFGPEKSKMEKTQRVNVVILLSQMRSGSSVLGELFNQRVNVSFFYEPLYPFGDDTCDTLLGEARLQVLEKISKCRFDLQEHYKQAYATSNLTDSFARCMRNKLCFTSNPKCSIFLSRDAKICERTSNGFQNCPTPINSTSLSSHCNRSLLRAMKVIYLCKIEWLIPLLREPSVNVKVLHLVRDPRATVNSRLVEARTQKFGSGSLKKVRKEAKLICQRLANNVKYADEVIGRDLLLQQKYMRIRHEDFAMDPLGASKAIYDYAEMEMTKNVLRWLKKATSTKNDKSLSEKNTQSTSRDSKYVVSGWRKKLKLQEVMAVQEECKDALALLHYRMFSDENRLRDVANETSFKTAQTMQGHNH